MICSKCGSQNADSAMFCGECGASLLKTEPGYGQPVAETLETQETPDYGAPSAADYGEPVQQQQQPVYQQPVYAPMQNRVVLPCTRGLLKYILLTIITCGIYAVVVQSRLVDELNIAASSHDAQRTPSVAEAGVYIALTFGIYSFVWNHRFAKRIGNELARRGIGYGFGASSYWLWNILGALIIVGPLVYMHKLLKAMNLINQSYNSVG